ncbi:protein slender lobes [Drosophila bipectinata]|uniref:protein slender lobes n=1 Tax=Drosophila bipectinata TaxID=42026 RepID=UPI001C899227|nr:protein slender lobes [Drosophila bipectinata]
MEENTESSEGQRVTRARTRRMSLLDTDSRPGTPQLDSAAERGTASPRPTRRTRLNSATMDVRTPTRATRSSVARGETPEPSTPSSVKRTARTPAKATRSVMKQLPLKEETAEEMDAKQEEQVERTGTPVGDRRVTRSMSQTPPSVNRSTSATPPSQPDSKVSSEEKQTAASGELKEEQDKKKEVETKEKKQNAQFTNKFSVRLEKTPLKRASENTPRKDSSESAKKTKSSDVEIDENNFPVEKIKALNESSSTDKKTVAPAVEIFENNSPVEKIKALNESSPTDKKTVAPAVEIVDNNLQVEKIKALNESSPNLSKVSKKPDGKETDPEESLKKTVVPEPEEQPHKLDEKTLSPELQTSTGEAPKELSGSPSPKNLESNGLATSPLKAKTPIKKEQSKEIVKEITPQQENSQTLPEKEVSPAKSPKNVSSDELFLDAEESPEELDNLKSTPNKEKEVETDLTAKQPTEPVTAKDIVESPEPMDVDEAIDDEEENVDLVEETVEGSPKLEQKKTVGFKGGDGDSHDEKTRFPKTPGRDKGTINRTNILVPETPIRTPKPAALSKGRSSSTPIAKDQLPSKAELHQAPPEIDVIKPFSQLESEKKEKLHDTSSSKTAKSPKILKLFSDDEFEEDNDSENECEFVEDQAVEAPGNYQSGDSMDSSTRREVEENEIPSHGESVGSQDTEEESHGEEEENEDDSFVVSDDDEEEDLGALCFSNDEEDESEVETEKKRESKGGKKRSRIVVADSSEDSIEMLSETKQDKSNCLNASRLSDAAQKMNNSSKNSTTETSETELENSRRMLLNELNKSERLNKTVPRLDVTEIEDNSSTDSEEKPVSKKASFKGSASVYEVMDSDEFEAPEEVKEPSHKELETSKRNESIYEVEESDEDQEPVAGDDKLSMKTSGKSSDEEAALLDTLASSDLRHLATMFNPLQKSRRQSLYTASQEINAKEPKLKRRSDRGLASDNFCPSTSFVEMVADRQRLKRKHLSKSFSGAPEDLDEVELHHDRKRLKNSPLKFDETEKNAEVAADSEKPAADLKRASTSSEEFVDDNSELSEGEIPRKSLQKDDSKNVSLRKDAVKESSPEVDPKEGESGLKEDSEVADEQPSTSRDALKPKAKQPESLFKTKTVDYYMEYCDKIFQAANEAAMNQKKQRIAAGGKKPKNLKRASMSGTKPGNKDPEAETVPIEKPLPEDLPKTSHKIASIATKKEAKPTTSAKKDVKRLQATRQAVGHAVNLLTGSAATKEPRSLANKLGAKSQMAAKKPGKKQKQAKLNSSDEENHNRKVTRFRNNAGYVTVLEGTPAKHSIELIRTKSGIMRVEPSTPKQKYFLEMPETPRNLQGGFREEPSGSSGCHLKGKKPGRKQAPKPGEDKGNSAKQSALRFKERVFARKF